MSKIDYMVILDGIPLIEYVLFKDYKPDDDWQCLNFTQEHILLKINEAPYLSMSEIAHSIGVDKGPFSHTVNKLVKDGFVTQQRCSKDRRKVYLSMTEKGDEYCSKVREKINNHLNTMLEQLPNEDRNAVIEAAYTIKSAAYKLMSKSK